MPSVALLRDRRQEFLGMGLSRQVLDGTAV